MVWAGLEGGPGGEVGDEVWGGRVQTLTWKTQRLGSALLAGRALWKVAWEEEELT